MVQLAFVAILPFVLPALGANMQARNNWGSSIAATPVPITSTVFASPAFPTGVISSIAASPAFPSGDVGTTTVVAIPAPSYFDCGGSNFTITSSIGGVPTGVTTVVVPIGTASSWASSGPVGTASSWTSSVAAGTPSVISSRLAARENWGISSSFAVPTSVAASSSFIPGGTASASSFTFIPGGTASGSGGVCPFPTSTAYASSSGIVSVSASPSGSLASGAQLGQQGGSDAGSAIGMTVSAGSVVLGAIAVVAQLL